MKRNIPRLVFGVLGRILLGCISVGFFILAFVTAREHVEPSDYRIKWVIFACVMAAGIITIPVTRLVYTLLSRKAGPRMQQVWLYAKMTVYVMRGQLTLVLMIIAALTFKQWGDALQYVVPIPVKENQLRIWEDQIRKGNGSGVESEVRSVVNYRKRVNLSRLAAQDLKKSYTEAQQYRHDGAIDDARGAICGALNRFDAERQLRAIKSNQFDKSPLKKYIDGGQLSNILIEYAELSLGQDDAYAIDSMLQYAQRIDPRNSKLLLLQADASWRRDQMCDAVALYRQYAEALKTKGISQSIPERVTEIVNCPRGWGSSSAAQIVRWWLRDAEKYWFASSSVAGDAPIRIDNRAIGRFQYETNEIIHSSKIAEYPWLFIHGCKPVGQEAGGSELQALKAWEKLAGCSIAQPNSGNERFLHLNPKFVTWANNNLIPASQSRIGEANFQLVYDRVFRDFFRLKAFGYKYLTSVRAFDEEMTAYQSAFTSDDFYGPSWLQTRYGNVSMADNQSDQTYVAQTMGFWLRRGLDGSADELWRGLSQALATYDPQFLRQLEDDPNGFVLENESEAGEEEQASDETEGE